MSIFICVPEDVIKWVIIPFLTIDDRLAFTAALEPTERIYKKFPVGFAIQHALRVAFASQRRRATIINYLVEIADNTAYKKAVVTELGLYADFFCKPVMAPVFIYRPTSKVNAITELTNLIANDSAFYHYLTEEVHTKVIRAITHIQSL
jgi:hypothetical protein